MNVEQQRVILKYLKKTNQKEAVILFQESLFLVGLMVDPGNQFTEESSHISIKELPPPIELPGLVDL